MQLIQYVYQQHAMIPLVLTNPGQKELARRFVRLYKKEMVNLTVLPLGLGQVAALIGLCEYMVTGDTSLMHLSWD